MAMRDYAANWTSSCSPHIANENRKSLSGSSDESDEFEPPSKPRSWNSGKAARRRKSHTEEDDPASIKSGISAISADSRAKAYRKCSELTLATCTTAASDSHSIFYPEATFGESIFVAQKKKAEEYKDDLIERSERILKFARKRLKKSRVEAYFEKKKKKNAASSKGGGKNNGGVLHVAHSDLELDGILGNGSYNVVYSVKSIKGRLLDPKDIVIKTLRSKLLTDLPMLAACAADLRKEGLILAALQQSQEYSPKKDKDGSKSNSDRSVTGASHIVKVHAWSPTGLSAFANGCHDSYFLVLERLDRTLTDTIKEWKQLEEAGDQRQHSFRLRRRSKNFLSFFKYEGDSEKQPESKETKEKQQRKKRPSTESKSKKSSLEEGDLPSNLVDPDQIQFWKMRLRLLIDLCGAISFLHSQRVIHRDLKPDNVGFDRNGKLKVFDFDVARVLPQQANWGDYTNEVFRMTKKVGSPRYMSPEVAWGDHYNEKSDVYALALLSYEVLSLKRPFDSLSPSDRVPGRGGSNIFKDCVQVVERKNDNLDNTSRSAGTTRRAKRRNSFPLRRPRSTSHGRSGKKGSITDNLFRRRSRSRGSSKKDTRKAPKYANIRPLLPVATPQEELAQQSESRKSLGGSRRRSHRSRSRSRARSRSMTAKSSTAKTASTTTRSIIHHHAVNDVDIETESFFWTPDIRIIIDRAWSYDIATRPLASELKVLISEELKHMEWQEQQQFQ